MGYEIHIHPTSWSGTEQKTGRVQHYSGATSFKSNMSAFNNTEEVRVIFRWDGDDTVRHFANSNDLRLEFVGINGLTIESDDRVKLLHGRQYALEAHATVSNVYQSTSTNVTSGLYPCAGLEDANITPLILGSTNPGTDATPWEAAPAIANGMLFRTGNRIYVRFPSGFTVPSILLVTWAEAGFRFDGCHDVVLKGLDIRGGSYAVACQDEGANRNSKGFTLDSCTIQAAQSAALYNSPTLGGEPGDWTITNNLIRWCKQGLLPIVQNTNKQNGHLTVTGNTIEYIGHHYNDSDRHGMNLENCTALFAKNTVRDSTHGVTTDYYDRDVNLDIEISENTFERIQWLGATWMNDPTTDAVFSQGYGVEVLAAQAQLNPENMKVVIRDNTIDTVDHVGIRVNAIKTDSGEHKLFITGNTISTGLSGITFIAGNPTTQWANGVQGAYVADNTISGCDWPICWLQNGSSGEEDTDANRHYLKDYDFLRNSLTLEAASSGNVGQRGAFAAMGDAPYVTTYANSVYVTSRELNNPIVGEQNSIDGSVAPDNTDFRHPQKL